MNHHLKYNIITRTLDGTTGYFAKLFRLRLERYLHGVGHPLELWWRLRDLGISEEDFRADESNPLLRANLVLHCGTESDMLPIEDNWQIFVSFPSFQSNMCSPCVVDSSSSKAQIQRYISFLDLRFIQS
jgi:hypothetical protein